MTSQTRIIPLHAVAPGADLQAATEAPLSALPPLSLYIHYPWCVKKCPYCDFNSHAQRSAADAEAEALEQAYLDALIADIEAALPAIWGRRIHTVFIGGGTPSLMSATALERLLSAVRMLLPLAPSAEVTMEANPGTFEAVRFRDYRAAGVNRLSIGIQSFNDAHLRSLGRIHDSHAARAAIDIAQRYFDRVNLDLMYALPGQTLEQTLQDVKTALAIGVTHLSCYNLTLEPNTLFHRAPPALPDDDIAADMQDGIEACLTSAGFLHYETSAYAHTGQACQHNLNYWTFGDYLGIGAGAHSKLSSHEGIVREVRHRHPKRYLSAAPQRRFIQEAHAVAMAERPFEFMMNALRLTDGFPPALFQVRTGLPLAVIRTELEQARQLGLLDIHAELIRPSERGSRFLNDLLALFLKST